MTNDANAPRTWPLVVTAVLVTCMLFAGAGLAWYRHATAPIEIAKQHLRIVGLSLAYGGERNVTAFGAITLSCPPDMPPSQRALVCQDPATGRAFALRGYRADGSSPVIVSGPYKDGRFVVLRQDLSVVIVDRHPDQADADR